MAASVAVAWLLLACGIILGSVALALFARIVICVAVATPGIVAICRVFLLRGSGCITALSWQGGEADFQVRRAGSAAILPAMLTRGSFRLGTSCLLLWLRTSNRQHAVFIDGNRQETGAFRGLCRRLRWPPRVP